jgi:hypothetical protein
VDEERRTSDFKSLQDNNLCEEEVLRSLPGFGDKMPNYEEFGWVLLDFFLILLGIELA